ncbi:MAG: hypothetical protein KIS92_03165 [Planctomycetota bacterium]|nr:hypothetical protein [Planctomycetota bacterium]
MSQIFAVLDKWAWETILEQDTVPPNIKDRYIQPWKVLFRVTDYWHDPDSTVLLRHPLLSTWIIKQAPWVAQDETELQ